MGIIVVDGAARVVFANDGAEALLAAGDGLRVIGGILRLAQPNPDSRLYWAIAACAADRSQLAVGPYIQLERGMDGSPLLVEVLPYRGGIARKVAAAASYPAPVAMLVVHDPDKKRDAQVAMLRERHGLTLAEAGLAVEMLRGDGRAAAAERCGISINTARTHLMRVFEKTGVTRQAELIRLLLD